MHPRRTATDQAAARSENAKKCHRLHSTRILRSVLVHAGVVILWMLVLLCSYGTEKSRKKYQANNRPPSHSQLECCKLNRCCAEFVHL